jgi:hypothetical protein
MFRVTFARATASVVFALALSHPLLAVDLTSTDVGDAANLPGTTDIQGDTIAMTGAGHDIWDGEDGFRFTYLELDGDFDAEVQITYFMRGIDPWAKAGLMARDTIDPNSINIISTADEDPSYGTQVSWREQTGGDTSEWNLWENGGPTGFDDGDWVRLTREGDDFTGYYHAEGDADWIPLDPVEIDMPDPILVGLELCSHDAGVLTEAEFEHLTIASSGVNYPAATAVEARDRLALTWATLKRP